MMKSMKKSCLGALVAASLLMQFGCTNLEQQKPAEEVKKAEIAKGVHAFSLKSIEGEQINLSQYRGKLLLLVNTASKCGLTKQYTKLQELHERYSARGLMVIGIPANNFLRQEPGTNEQIAAFCKQNYGVTFQMMEKIEVKGGEIHPLYQYLTKEAKPTGAVSWNFEKFLIGTDGEILARFKPRVKPDSKEIHLAIETHLPKNKN